MKNLLFLLTCCLTLFCCTPKPSHKLASDAVFMNKYADKIEAGSTLIRAGYHYSLEKTSSGKFIKKTYFPDTRQMTHFYSYTDQKMTSKEGLAKEWWDNGQLIFEGQYIDNKREGNWKRSPNFGQTLSSGIYKNGEQEGLWIERDTAGQLRSEYNYKAGKLHGPFKVWDKKGNLLREGNYVDEVLEWEKKYDTDEKVELFPIVEEMPYMAECENSDKEAQKTCSEKVMLQSIYKIIRYPAVARQHGVEGMAIVRFVVEKDGSVTEIEVVRGLCKEIAMECGKVVRMMPPWKPGKQNGVPVRVQFNLPVKFKLE